MKCKLHGVASAGCGPPGRLSAARSGRASGAGAVSACRRFRRCRTPYGRVLMPLRNNIGPARMGRLADRVRPVEPRPALCAPPGAAPV